MIGTMRKHSTWLWSIIIVVVIFAFVIWGTNPGSQGGGPAGRYGTIDGQRISEEDYLGAQREVYLLVGLRTLQRTGEWPTGGLDRLGVDVPRETFSRLLLIRILQDRKMYAGAEAKALLVGNILSGLKPLGVNTLTDLETFLGQQGLSLADLDRAAEHEIALQQLRSVEGLTGQLMTPDQIESFWKRENQEISAQVVFFSASNYLNRVNVTPEAVGTYFTNQMARYRIPDRMRVQYVAYAISNYLEQADERLASLTNLTAQLDAEYERRGTNYYADVSPEEAKEQIREELRLQFAGFETRQAAAAFADELWRQEPMKPEDMNTLGAEKGLTVVISEPFDRTSVPAGLDVDPNFAQLAFRLRADEPYAGPIAGADHYYVITTHERIPSTNARFEDVKAQVTEDYRMQQAQLMARERGEAFTVGLTNGLAMSKPFTELCVEAQVTPELLPPFSRSTSSLPEVEAHASLNLFKQAAFATPVGKASRFNLTSDGGYVVYVASQLAVDEALLKEELPRYAEFVRQSLQNEAFGLWMNQQAQSGLRDTPIGQAPQSQVAAPGT
jgi:peptidyl-prolyl cis-trans isomerase D